MYLYVPKQLTVEYPQRPGTVRETWRAWCAAAAAFSADLPSALNRDAIAEDYPTYSDAVGAIMRAIADAVVRTQLEDDDEDTIVRAGIELDVSPDETTIAFGSGRSVARLHLYTLDDSTLAGAWLDVGCWHEDDSEDCMGSMRARCRAAWETLS